MLLQKNMAESLSSDIPCESIGDQGFLSFLLKLPDKPNTTVRIFDRGEFFTVHNEDATYCARQFFKTITVVKELRSGSTKIPSVVLSKNNFEGFIRNLLLLQQYRVELYRSRSGNQWQLIGKASPGNLHQFEEVLFRNNRMSESAVVLCLKLSNRTPGQKIISAAFSDVSARTLTVCEFSDNEHFSNLEGFLLQIEAKECLATRTDLLENGEQLKQILERSHVLTSERKKSDYESKDIRQDLNRLVKSSSMKSITMFETNFPHALTCLACIFKYLEILSDETLHNQFTMNTFDLTQYMRLDLSAFKAMNILQTESEGGSLLGLLNQCKTSQGERLLSQWVKQPLLDSKKIEERLDIVEAFIERSDIKDLLQASHLKRIPDMTRLSKKFQQHKATLQDCVRVYQAVKQLPAICESLGSYNGKFSSAINENFCNPLQETVNDFSKFLELIETTVDLEEVRNHEYLIKPEFDVSLQECKTNMINITEQLNDALDDAARVLSLEAGKTLKLDSNNQLGHFFRVTLKEEKILRTNKKFKPLETRKDGVRFTNSTLSELSILYKSHRATYNELQSQLTNEVIKIAAGYAEPMQTFGDVIAHLDVLLSFSQVASQACIPYTRPDFTNQGKIILKESRHPCVESQHDVAFIPNDLSLVKGSEEFLIVTGPNMGGKSTFIRQTAVIVLMAQMGCFVPCTSAELCVVDCVMARVGAGDCQMKGVSTFMSEMIETAAILNSATENSLIIMDELGRGTSTFDGFGLAWAISEHIVTQIHAFCLFATHFHEMTSLAEQLPTVRNFHVSALTSKNHLTLLYRVKPGACDQSFGINVAEIAKLPESVIKFAREKVKLLENGVNEDDLSDEASVADVKLADVAKYTNLIQSIPISTLSNEELYETVQSIRAKKL